MDEIILDRSLIFLCDVASFIELEKRGLVEETLKNDLDDKDKEDEEDEEIVEEEIEEDDTNDDNEENFGKISEGLLDEEMPFIPNFLNFRFDFVELGMTSSRLFFLVEIFFFFFDNLTSI